METQPVNIVDTDKPIEVVNVGEAKKEAPRIVKKADAQTLAPTTTDQQDKTKAGQRRINLIWEFTQAVIAVSITWAIIYMAIKAVESDTLTNAFFLIVAMYFVRTNHQLTGGPGPKPVNESR